MLAINQIRRRVLFGIQLLTFTWGMHGNAFAGSIGATANPFDASDAEPGLSVAVEYYHPGLDHYFLTADPTEIQALANGRFQGWVTTGQKFAVLPPDSTVGTSTPVCRFYSQRLGSHFYSAQPNECDEVKVRFSDSWTLESDDVYRAFLPDAWGACPLGTQAVYRLWNNRADSNHRYTTDPSIAMTMKAKGYVAEGLGLGLSLPVALCAPVGIACALAVSDPAPATGSQVTLTATCTGQPSSYVWSGCDSKTDTCSTTSVDVGIKAYGVVARAPTGVSDATAIAVDWRPLVAGTPAQPPSCTISASNITPAAGTSVTLSVLCTVLPTSYSWTGCTSTGNSCTTSSAGAGAATYTVSATTPAGNASPASITINWQGPSTATSNPTPTNPNPTPTPPSTSNPIATSAPTTNAARTPIASIPAGEVRVISSNSIADVWQGAQPAGGGSISKAIAAWNSSIVAPTLGTKGSIIFAGGGDWDSWDTAAFAFDIATGVWARIIDRTNALSWNPAADYALPASDPHHFDVPHGEHGDGTPGAPHTYDLMNYLPPDAVGGKGALLYPVSRFAYPTVSTNWSHKLTLDRPVWSRASSAPVPANTQLLGMSDYDPTTKRVWILAATDTGSLNNQIQYLDFSDGSGVGVPGSVPLDTEYLIYAGTMRFWRGVDGTKRYLVMLSGNRNSHLNIIDLDAPVLSIHQISIANLPPTWQPGSPVWFAPGFGFALGRNIGFALHPMPDQDGFQIYEITPPADAVNGAWTVTAKPIVGVTLPSLFNNNGLFKRLEWHEALGVATFFLTSTGPVYAYRPGTAASQSTPTTPPATTTTPPPTTTPPATTTAPAPAVGSLAVSVTAVPFTGLATALGNSKHLDFARLPDASGQMRWYKMAGDHTPIDAGSPSGNDGRQEILSFTVAANDWREDQPYYVMDPSQVQFAFPDDALCMVRNDEAFVINTVTTNAVPPSQPPGAAKQIYGHLMAWKPGRGWRDVGPLPSMIHADTAWRGIYDAATDRFIIPSSYSGLWWVQMSGSGADLGPIAGGDHDFSVAGIVQDGRNGYVYDQRTAELYRVDLDTFALTLLAKLPEPVEGGMSAVKIAWHPDLRAVVVAANKLYAYEVDKNALTTWDRPDGFVNGIGKRVPTSTIFFDPDTRDIVSVGTIDWDTGIRSPNYWRLHLSR